MDQMETGNVWVVLGLFSSYPESTPSGCHVYAITCKASYVKCLVPNIPVKLIVSTRNANDVVVFVVVVFVGVTYVVVIFIFVVLVLLLSLLLPSISSSRISQLIE